MKKNNSQLNKEPVRNTKPSFVGGFTIIEMMIAISIFLIVVTIGMNGLLQTNVVLNKSKDMRNIMDNLSFVMEDMSRSLRTGYNYRCYDVNSVWPGTPSDVGQLTIQTPRSCDSGHAIAFEEASTGSAVTGADQWVYKFGLDPVSGAFTVYKSINGGTTFYPLNDSRIQLSSSSGISVLAAEPQDVGNDGQPFVMIRLSGEIDYKGIKTPFNLQTSVSQVLIDVDNTP